MTTAEMTRDQLIALVRQQAAALDAAQMEADARQRVATNTVPGDHKRCQHELDEAVATAAKLRKEVLGKGRR